MNSNTVNVTLWQREIWKKPFHIQRVIDEKDIKMIEKNVFNITKLRHTDQGKYYCKADCAGKEKYAGEIFVNKGKLEPKVQLHVGPFFCPCIFGRCHLLCKAACMENVYVILKMLMPFLRRKQFEFVVNFGTCMTMNHNAL